MLSRFRRAEAVASRDYEQAPPESKPAFFRIWNEVAETLRKMEKDGVQIERARRESVPLADAQRIYAESHGVVAAGLKSQTKRLAPKLAKVGSVRECAAIIAEDHARLMEGLAEDLSKLGKAEAAAQ